MSCLLGVILLGMTAGYIGLILPIRGGSASLVKSDAQGACLSPEWIQHSMFERVGTTAGVRAFLFHGERPVLLASECWKRVFQYRGVHIVFYRKIAGSTGSLAIRSTDAEKSHSRSSQCLDEAVKGIESCGSDSSRVILNALKRSEYQSWYDMDTGPAWPLDCRTKPGSPRWGLSLANFIHEAVHALSSSRSSPHCIFFSQTGRMLCFDSSVNDPSPAGIGSESARGDNAKDDHMEEIQKEYIPSFAGGDWPVMFEELQACASDTRLTSALLSKYGRAILLNDRGDREYQTNLPLLLALSARFLDSARRERPDWFKENFAQGSINRKSAVALLKDAEEAYKGWLRLLSIKGVKTMPAEDNLWREYGKVASNLFP